MSGYNEEKQSDPLLLIVGGIAFVAILCLLVWLVASAHIVWATLNPLMWMAAVWKIVPFLGAGRWNEAVGLATQFSANPRAAGLFNWLWFVNLCLFPVSCVLTAFFVGFGAWVARKQARQTRIFRALSPKDLLEHTSGVFSGIAPIIKIRDKISMDKLPQWRRQVTPEEVFLGSHPVLLPSGKIAKRPMIRNGEFDNDVARQYFTGLVGRQPIDNRMNSRMLGRQAVDLVVDRKNSGKICFPDRFSNEGRALYALWACVAFGGKQGKEEYVEYSKKLNLSAYGSEYGAAKLTVVQPLYDKYRMNKEAAKLFAVHHWEHTYLFALLGMAQRRGRYTTAETLWLRPMNRIMFFSLNSCGAKTPHVEAAATFNHYQFEVECAKSKHLPLFRDDKGRLRHMICVEQAVDGLRNAFLHWSVSSDENEDWWKSDSSWRIRDEVVSSALKQSEEALKAVIEAEKAQARSRRAGSSPVGGTETAFDQQMNSLSGVS